jgi:hypothetical protein
VEWKAQKTPPGALIHMTLK